MADTQRKAMVVDDDDRIRRMVSAVFKGRFNLAVDEFADSLAALERLKHPVARDYTLILSDIDMPNMSGIELSRVAAEFIPHVPFVLMTGEKTKRQIPEHVREVYPKPIGYKEIISLVQKHMAS